MPAGTYTLWTIPRIDHEELVVNKQVGQWGTGYGKAHDLGRAALHAQVVSEPVEQVMIAIDSSGARRGTLSMSWGTFRWTAPIVLR